MPLMKMMRSLTAPLTICTVEGMLVGGMEKTLPSEEKQKAARMTDREKMKGCDTPIPRARPRMMGTSEIASPKPEEARISPRMMVSSLTGQDMSRSSVLAWASQGVTTGEMLVAVKNRIIPRSPGIRKSIVRCRPMAKAKNKEYRKKDAKDEHWSLGIIYADILAGYGQHTLRLVRNLYATKPHFIFSP